MARDLAQKHPVFEALSPYLAEVEEEMRAVLSTSEPALRPFYELLHYHLGWVDERLNPTLEYRGKRIRPALCLLVCEALGGKYEQAVPAAAAVELVHNFSLIHDDIEDRSPERRGRSTLWRLWGESIAINAGDGLMILSHLALHRLALRGVSIERIPLALGILDAASLSLCQGQYLDLAYQDRLDVTPEMYLKMAEKKTAALLEGAAHLGALIATERPALIEAARAFARFLGLAFQIADDLLGIWGDPQRTGKAVGEDIRARKKSLPIVWALQEEKQRNQIELANLYGATEIDERALSRVMALLEELGAREYAEALAAEYRERALTELNRFPASFARDRLRELALFLSERRF